MGSVAGLLWGVLFSAIGFGYFLYGKKQRSISPLLFGVALMGFPYFVSNTWVLFLVVRALNRLLIKEAEKPAKPAEASRQEVLLQEIRDILAKRPA